MESKAIRSSGVHTDTNAGKNNIRPSDFEDTLSKDGKVIPNKNKEILDKSLSDNAYLVQWGCNVPGVPGRKENALRPKDTFAGIVANEIPKLKSVIAPPPGGGTNIDLKGAYPMKIDPNYKRDIEYWKQNYKDTKKNPVYETGPVDYMQFKEPKNVK